MKTAEALPLSELTIAVLKNTRADIDRDGHSDMTPAYFHALDNETQQAIRHKFDVRLYSLHAKIPAYYRLTTHC